MAKPILFFDSGVGGLSVAQEVRRKLPLADFIYMADHAAFPYGNWEAEALLSHALDLLELLILEHDPGLIVIACNSLSTLVLPSLRARFHKPVVGTVPAIKPAAEKTRTGRVTLLATPGTVARRYTHDLIVSFAQHIHVDLVAAPNLAQLAEQAMAGESLNAADLLKEIMPCFRQGPEALFVEETGQSVYTDAVVLACTHYPLLRSALQAVAPWPVLWVDSGEAIARRVISVIHEEDTKGQAGFLALSTQASEIPKMSVMAQRLFAGDFNLILESKGKYVPL